MEIRGHIYGSDAERYRGFAYEVPIPFDFGASFPPQALYLGPATRMQVDYLVQIGETNRDGFASLEAYLIPNKYTIARHEVLILRRKVAVASLFWQSYIENLFKGSYNETQYPQR